MSETTQHMTVLVAIPLEEDLIGAEDTRHAIHRNTTMTEDVEIVVPELVLYEECHHWAHGTQKATSIANGIEGQIADDVGTAVVLPDFIARG